MTGFGRGEQASDDLTVVVEVKSVNHRFKDVRFKMSSVFSSIELALKKDLTKKFQRGSFDVFVNYKKNDGKSRFDDLDQQKVSDYLQRLKALTDKADVKLEVSATEFLRQEFMTDQDDGQSEKMLELLTLAFSKAMTSLEQSRVDEGQKLLENLKEHRAAYVEHFKIVENKTPEFKKHVEERLKKRVTDFSQEMNMDESRLMQEVVFYLEKMDVQEEVNRIHAHLQKLDELFKGKAEIGRQIDFLIQELNRETNTIGSKSAMKEISDAVVQMKVQLEKMREQGLNLE